jgi:energy-converting hydrogenase B subunit C
MFGIDPGIINMIQSILLVISALLILIAVVGVLRIDRNLDNVVYARIHILGIVDVAGIIAFLALGQPLFALIYLFLAPLLAHALANAYFHSEDTLNNPVLNPNIDETLEEIPIELEESEEDLDLSDDSGIDENLEENSDSSDDSGIDENLEESEDDGND